MRTCSTVSSLATLSIIISLAGIPHLKTFSQNAMICANLKQLSKYMTKYGIHKEFQRIVVISFTQFHLDYGVVLAEFTYYS